MKKTLLVSLLMVPMLAMAGTMLQLQNQSGGYIKLTDEKCPTQENALFAYTTSKTGEFVKGCWKLVDSMVLLNFENGATRAFEIDSWEVTPYGEKIIRGIVKQKKNVEKNKEYY